MTAVVEVGPVRVRGSKVPPFEHVSVAIGCIDDEYALLDGQLVEVPRLWRDVLAAAFDESVDRLTLVVPTWWPAAPVIR